MSKGILTEQSVRVGNRRMSEFVAFVKECDLNIHKIFCLRWQNSTGKKCTNRNHLKDKYKNEMECEASLTETLLMNIKLGSMNESQFKVFMKEIKDG